MSDTSRRTSPHMVIGAAQYLGNRELDYSPPALETSAAQMEEIQPLDLSMRPPVVLEPPYSGQQVPLEAKPSQELPLCLIKDCRCTKHSPNPRQPGDTPAFSDVKYDPPAVGDDAPRRSMPPEVHPVAPETGGYDSLGYECSPVPRRDIWTEGGRPWETRRQYCEERMDVNARQCDDVGTPAQNIFNSSHCPCTRTEVGTPNVRYSSMSKYYDTDDHNTQSYLDLMNSGNNMETAWKSSVNNEESSNDESNTAAQSWKLKRDWGRATSSPPKIHWRPFGDSTTHSESTTTPHQSPQEVITSTSSQTTVCRTSEASKVSSPGAGGKVIILSSATSQPPIIRSVGHCFASTVPLISHSTPVPAAPEVHNLGSSAASLMAARPAYPSIRVTRSPKTFHNELVRTFHEIGGGRGQAVKRSQDGGKRQVLDKTELLEKENINRSTGLDTPPGEDVPIGVRMPALDYLISKVLVERIDIPFKPCNVEIKKIYNGESKGRLRLVDLIELQVEESLKA